MNTDLELYRVFCEVVKYKNISRTAEKLYVSQSAITQSIQKLETLLGGKVFYRNKSGVELTEEGKNLYEYIKDSIETMNNAENIFSKYINLETGNIRIGGSNSLILSLIFNPLVTFIKKYPKINIAINNGKTDISMKKLSNGELDIVILYLPYTNKKYSNIEFIPLKKATYCFFASKKYLEKNPVKNLKDLENHTLILPKSSTAKKEILNNFAIKENLSLTPSYEITSSTITKQLVLNNIGIGFVDVNTLNEIKNEIEIIQEIEFDELKEGIATLKKNMLNKATLELIKEIKQYYAQ